MSERRSSDGCTSIDKSVDSNSCFRILWLANRIVPRYKVLLCEITDVSTRQILNNHLIILIFYLLHNTTHIQKLQFTTAIQHDVLWSYITMNKALFMQIF